MYQIGQDILFVEEIHRVAASPQTDLTLSYQNQQHSFEGLGGQTRRMKNRSTTVCKKINPCTQRWVILLDCLLPLYPRVQSL